MKEQTRAEPRFSLCGLNCGLCPMYHISETEHCTGCGGAGGDANIAFLDGRTLWPDGGEEYTVDGVHPTDLGFYFMARGLLPVLLPYLTEE